MSKTNSVEPAGTLLASSFRDPAGFIFTSKKGELLRQVTEAGAADFELLISSGLYDELLANQLLVSHQNLKPADGLTADARAVIKPQQIPFISYPFEWSFSQLKDAALLTLDIQKRALLHGMVLKDASAYNVQFLDGRPIFIDTLSFEAYHAGEPWQAYRQFCQHFLAPLALAAHVDISLTQFLRVHLDGVPLNLCAKLLPAAARLKPGLLMHIFLHAQAQKAKASEHRRPQQSVTQPGLAAILDSLERTVNHLKPRKQITEWGDYYDKTNYTIDAADKKAMLITSMVRPLGARTALDLGGNNGRYSRILTDLGLQAVCTDIDPNAVEANYRFARLQKETLMLPLLVDLVNPGGALGWGNTERPAIHQRLQTDVVMALALVHHLAISNNLPLGKIAEYFSKFGPYLLIEFVPKSDSQVQKLLSTRKDIFPDYTEEGLERAFGANYTLVKSDKISGSQRTLYLFKRK